MLYFIGEVYGQVYGEVYSPALKKLTLPPRVCVLSHSVTSDSFWTPWTVACQALLFMEFSRQEYWSSLPFPASGDLPNPGTEHMFHACPPLGGGFFTTAPPEKPSAPKW